MTHLSATELVDLLDGRLDVARLPHADTCEACRARVNQLRAALEAASAVPVPEPSPLFWQHLSTRVMQGIAAKDTSWSVWRHPAPHVWAGVAALAIVIGLAAIGTFKSSSGTVPRGPASGGLSAGTADVLPDTDDDLDADEAWAIVRTLADDVNWGETDAHEAGIAPGPGWANRAALSLTAAELSELARILEAEMGGRNGA